MVFHSVLNIQIKCPRQKTNQIICGLLCCLLRSLSRGYNYLSQKPYRCPNWLPGFFLKEFCFREQRFLPGSSWPSLSHLYLSPRRVPLLPPGKAENTKSHKLNTGSLISYYKTNSKTLTQLTSYQQAQLTEVQTACKISAESVIPCLIYPSHTACANCDAKPKLIGSIWREQNLHPARIRQGLGTWQHQALPTSPGEGLRATRSLWVSFNQGNVAFAVTSCHKRPSHSSRIQKK